MIGNPVAQAYADALFAIGQEDGSFDALQEELRTFSELLRSQDELRIFLQAPGIASKKKVEVAEAILEPDFSEIFRNFVSVLIEKRRVGQVEMIATVVAALSDQVSDILRGEIYSAVELSEEKLEEIRALVRKHTGKREVALATNVDPSLIAGLVIQYGDTRIDGSLKNRLDTVRHSLQSQGGLL